MTTPAGNPVLHGQPGQTITVGSKVRVTLLAMLDPTQPAPGAPSAGTGQRLVAAQLRVENLASTTVTVPLGASTTVVSDEDQAFQVRPGAVAGCPELAVSPTIAGNATSSGCLAFVVPVDVTLSQLMVALPDGSDPVIWKLH